MKQRITTLLIAGTCILVYSCIEKAEPDKALLSKIDSLTQVNTTQREQIGHFEGFISSLAQTMDSIDAQEQILVQDKEVGMKGTFNRQRLKENLQRYKEIIDRQKERIALLEQRIAAGKDSMSAKMQQIVAFYKKELEAKDMTISMLQKDINAKNFDIKQLRTHVEDLQSANTAHKETIAEQKTTLNQQTVMLNTAYIKIGTKKELKNCGLLTGGFLRKTKLDASKLQTDLFNEVDMRVVNDIEVKSKNPKILTQMPASSYQFVDNGNGTSTLHITSPAAFWSISRFLVIQL